eukprot:TRINITY_DN8104_c0_g4_i2.p1 TRINITY_DN8104_c0_g4~~TRINITY_DN8104_c0_g4_i2.p1  ORF type:complete len:822 (-),score=201.65 TRINITY_DN8104_c0_g4_i2:107-2572(-)
MGNQPSPQSYFEPRATSAGKHYGPMTLGPTLTLRTVRDLMLQFQRPQNSALLPNEVGLLLSMAKQEFAKLGAGIELDVPEGTTLTVVGDLHGQLFDLVKIFQFNGEPSATNRYLFDGDFVDRGKHGAEVFLTLAAWKVLYPEYVHLLRGNHEVSTINEYYGFEEELRCKYPKDPGMRYNFNAVFATLPVWALVNEKIFVVHGGLPKQAQVTNTSVLRKLSKVNEPIQESLFQDLLWSDPQDPEGFEMSERGAGIMWGPDITDFFLANNNFDMIIRAHQMCMDGFRMQHNGKVLTVFSAANYCGRCGNRAAIVKLKSDKTMTIHTFIAANQTSFMARAQDPVAVRIPVTHPVGTVHHHDPETPFYVGDPDQAVDVQPSVTGHALTAGANGVCLSADGSLLCTTSVKDFTLQLWESNSKGFKHLLSLRLPVRPHKACWHGDKLGLGFLDGTVMVFSTQGLLKTAAEVSEWKHQAQECETDFASAFFPMQNEYDDANETRKVELNSMFEAKQVERLQRQQEIKNLIGQCEAGAISAGARYKAHEDAVTQLSWSRSGSMLVTCSRDRKLIVWSCEPAAAPEAAGPEDSPSENSTDTVAAFQLLPITSVSGNVPFVDLSWKGESEILVAAGGVNGLVHVFDLFGASTQDLSQVHSFQVVEPTPVPIYAVCFNSAGTMLAAAGKHEAIHLYDEDFNRVQKIQGTHSVGITQLKFSLDDTMIASAGMDSAVRIWSVTEALDIDQLLDVVRGQMAKVTLESTAEEKESWQQQLVELRQGLQKAMLVGLSDKPQSLCWVPSQEESYRLVAVSDSDMSVAVWDFAKTDMFL